MTRGVSEAVEEARGNGGMEDAIAEEEREVRRCGVDEKDRKESL